MAKEKKQKMADTIAAIKEVYDMKVSLGLMSREAADEEMQQLINAAEAQNKGNDLSDEQRGTLTGINDYANHTRAPKTKEEKENDRAKLDAAYTTRKEAQLKAKAAREKYGISAHEVKTGDTIKVVWRPTEEDIKNNTGTIIVKINDKEARTFPLDNVANARKTIKEIADAYHVVNNDGKELTTVYAKSNTKALPATMATDVKKLLQTGTLPDRLASYYIGASDYDGDDSRKKAFEAERAFDEKMLNERALSAAPSVDEKEQKNERLKLIKALADSNGDEAAYDALLNHVLDSAKLNAGEPVSDFDKFVRGGVDKVFDFYRTFGKDTQNPNQYDKAIQDNQKRSSYRSMPDYQKDVMKVIRDYIKTRPADMSEGGLFANIHNITGKAHDTLRNAIRKASMGISNEKEGLNTKAKQQLEQLIDSGELTEEQKALAQSFMGGRRLSEAAKQYSDDGFASRVKKAELYNDIMSAIDAKITGIELNPRLTDKQRADKLDKLSRDKDAITYFIKGKVDETKRLRDNATALAERMAAKAAKFKEGSPEYDAAMLKAAIATAQASKYKGMIHTTDDDVETVEDTYSISNKDKSNVEEYIDKVITPILRDKTLKEKWPTLYANTQDIMKYLSGAKAMYKYLPSKYDVTNALSGLRGAELVKGEDGKNKLKVSLVEPDELLKKYGAEKARSRKQVYGSEDEMMKAQQTKADLKNLRNEYYRQKVVDEDMAERSPEEQARLNALHDASMDRADREWYGKQEAERQRREAQSKRDVKRMTGIDFGDGDTKLKRSAEMFLNGSQANSKLRNGREYLAKSIANALKDSYPGIDVSKRVLDKLSLEDYARGVVSGSNKDFGEKIRVDLDNEVKSGQQGINDAVSQAFEYVSDDQDAPKETHEDYIDYGDDD